MAWKFDIHPIAFKPETISLDHDLIPINHQQFHGSSPFTRNCATWHN